MPNTSSSLDTLSPIDPLQSGTIRSAIKAIVVNVVALITIFTGKHFNIDAINSAIDAGVPMVINGISIYYGFKAIHGRINATQAIKKD